MSDFETFLSQNAGQATQPKPDALQPPDDFANFLAKAKGEQQASTLQQAQATTVVNAQQSTEQAAQAAKLAPKVGLPQAAVETDLPRYQQQALAEKNTAILNDNPVLAKWVVANPDSARVAQDEYDKLSGIEKLWHGAQDAAMAGAKGLAGSYSEAALGVNRILQGPASLVGAGDWWQRNMVQPRVDAQSAYALPENAGIGAKSAQMVGNLLGMLSQITLTGGGEGAAVSPMAGVGETIANATQNAARSMAFPSLTASVNTANDVLEKTGDVAAAAKAAVASYAFSTLQGAVPFSAPGSLATRAVSGAISSAATSEGQRAAMNLLMPESMRQEFNPQDLIFQALTGAALGGIMGPRAEQSMWKGAKDTYADALKAEQAETQIGKVAALGELATGSKLREADPEKFKEFVSSVTDKADVDSVYINANKLSEAFAQSKVEPTPDILSQMREAIATNGDVRIPVADYATHLAGTDIEKAILPELKASPDGMTYAEGQKFYAGATAEMQARAEKMGQEQQQRQEFEADKGKVYQDVLDQLSATNRNTDAVNKAYATLISEFYGAQAEREGVKPSELFAQNPLKVQAEAVDGLTQDARGAYNPAERIISLNKDADLSTFLHESGHFFLDTLGKIASGEGASDGAKSDFGTLLKWFGVKDADTWHAMSLDEQRAHHEKFAESFERYLLEGKAPSPELRTLFGRFRSWLLSVYRSVAGVGESLSPEVRGVMDRMLASDHAIKEAEQLRAYAPLFDNAKAAGMSMEEYNAYLEQGREATDQAVSEMQVRSMQDMKWLSNAKSKALKSLQRQADVARKAIKEQVANEVDQMPVFQVKDYLASHKNYDPEIVAEMNGYEDAHHMYQAIEQAGNKKDVIDAITDQRMLQEHGELVDPKSVEDAANAAVHNEARARFMATGLKALTKSPLPASQIAKAAKDVAESTIAGKRVGDLRPDLYLAAEARNNKEAIASAASDPAKAIEAQRAAILNNRLAKAAQDAKDEVGKGLDYLRKFDKPTVAKAIGADYMDRINELLSAYDVTNRFVTQDAVGMRMEMRDWLQSEFSKNGVMPDVSPELLDFATRKSWKELSVEEFRGLVDSVKSMEHVGRESTLITVNGQKQALQDLVDRAKLQMADLPHSEPIDVQPHLLHATGLDKISAQFLNLKSKVRGMDAALVKMEQMFQWLDHGKRAGLGEAKSGAFLDLFARASEAEGHERQMRAESSAALRDLGKTLRDAKVNLNESLDLPLQRPGRGGQWYREELLAAALNIGNAGNKDKLLRGYGWSEAKLMDVLDTHLSAAEWKFVQGVWDTVGRYGSQIAELQRRQTGVTPKMVEPIAVKTQHGDLAGGYYPIVYDAFLDKGIEQKQAKNSDMLFENQWARPATSKGHTIARTDYVGPIQLSLGVIARHVDQVTHDLAFREVITDMNKFLSHKEITNEVDQVMGREYRKQFRPWLQAMANDKVFNTSGDSAWENFYRKARTNATIVGLGFRLSTMLIHGSSAMSNSIGEVGAKWFAKGAAEFASPERWEAAKQFMYDRSPEMANRFNEHDRNVNEAIREINEHARSFGPLSATQKAVDGARRFAFYGVSALDMGSAAPTWMGAYLKGMAPESKGGLNMGEEAAIDYANRAVRNAHGGGGVKDLSAVQRDKGVMSLATMFYSFWNHMYNRQRDLAKGYANLPESFKQGTGTRDFAKLLARSWWYFVVPQLIHATLKPSPDQQEGDIGSELAHIGEEVGLGFVSGVPILRDLANAAINGRDYTITPLEQAGKSVVKAATDAYKAATGQETSKNSGKNAAQAAGYALGLPTGQLSATGSFLWDVYNGDADPQGIKDWYTGIQNGRISE